nr:reverse transcriptase domain-containing protein [Tanacetum cinerariifolium]
MPPRRLKQRAVERMVQKQVAEAIAEYKRNRTNLENAKGSGPANAGGVVAPDVFGCSCQTFWNCQPHSFNGTKGVVGLTCWFEKMEQVFEISKCAEEDNGNKISKSNKRKWENHQRDNNNNCNNNTYHRQQNRRHEAGKAYVATPVGGKVYLGNQPLCNRCKLHHHDQCSVKCKKYKRIGYQTKYDRSKTFAIDTPPTVDANA